MSKTLSQDALRRQRNLTRIQRFKLLDDTFFNSCFDGYPQGMELLLRIIKGRNDLKIVDMVTQNTVPNLYGREVRFDVFAKDTEGVAYDFEVQRSDTGAVPLRARYNSSLLDAMEVQKSTHWKNLPQTCVIFITEHDVLKGAKPIYHIHRTIHEMDHSIFNDGADIIYVNAACQSSDDPLGRLMHDFHCTNADDMYYPELAERVRFYKTNDKGVTKMCEIMNEVLNEGRAEGLAEGRIDGLLTAVRNLMAAQHLSAQEAMGILNVPVEMREVLLSKI